MPNAGVPGYPGYPPSADMLGSGGGPKRGKSAVVIALVAALVLIGGVVAGILTLGSDDGGKDDASAPSPGPSSSAPPQRQSPGPDGSDPGVPGLPGLPGIPGLPGDPQNPGDPQDPGTGSDGGDGSTAVDTAVGISLPVLDGWTGQDSSVGYAGSSVVTGEYPCPGDQSKSCVRGGAFAWSAADLKITSTDPEAAAKADIAPNAADAYGTATYGATTGHQQLASRSVTVAGQKGYLVRWKVTTKSGTDGYVESLAFGSPSDNSKLVIVRFGFDVGGKAPGQDVMDQITSGIKADTSGGSGSGSGTGV